MANQVSNQVLPQPTGPYAVGCVDVCIDSFPLIRIYYPAVARAVSSDPSLYAKWTPHPNYTTTYINFLNLRSVQLSNSHEDITQTMNSVLIPASNHVPLLIVEPPTHKYPVIIFSHGRGGMRTRCSAICCDLASHGYVVGVPEHCDGSSCLALRKKLSGADETVDEWIPYCQKGESESEFEFRNEQVMKRVLELKATRELMILLDKGVTMNNLMDSSFDLLQFKGHILQDTIGIIGHSFGGTTVLQSLVTEGGFKCGIVLDPWMMPLSEDLFGCEIKQPLLFINSSLHYQTPESIRRIAKLVKPPDEVTGISCSQMITIDGTVHRSQVDIAFVLAEYFVGKDKPTLEPGKCHNINIKLCHAFLKRFLLNDSDYQRKTTLLDGGDHDSCIIYGTNIKY